MYGSKMNLIWINLELFWMFLFLFLFLIYIYIYICMYVYILHLGDEDYGWRFLSAGMSMQ